jgi:hypothetical protein
MGASLEKARSAPLVGREVPHRRRKAPQKWGGRKQSWAVRKSTTRQPTPIRANRCMSAASPNRNQHRHRPHWNQSPLGIRTTQGRTSRPVRMANTKAELREPQSSTRCSYSDSCDVSGAHSADISTPARQTLRPFPTMSSGRATVKPEHRLAASDKVFIGTGESSVGRAVNQ